MAHYLVTLTHVYDGGEGEFYFWLPVGKNGKKRRFKPEPIKLTWWQKIITAWRG